MNRILDIRSDTVTQPTDEMRKAMAEAIVGDDIMGEDPTVKRLEKLACEIFGKEAAVFVTSGTMANQIAVMVYSKLGDEVIVGSQSHILNLEVGALAAICGVQARSIEVVDGHYDAEVIENAILGKGIQSTDTGLICLENTYNLNRGLIVTTENMKEIKMIGAKHKIPVYLDGARILNAAVAEGKDVKEFTKHVDALQVCLTKGLAAPFGSLLLGDKEFISKARKMKQRLGGGMRQAGIMAAAGVVALENMVSRLDEDHKRAKTLAHRLVKIHEGILEITEVQTNIVSLNLGFLSIDGKTIQEEFLKQGIKVKKIGDKSYRMIIHYQIKDEDIDYIADVTEEIIQRYKK
ncbi:threonine aldolase [Alkaliphilus pronyensis]|uniref:Threonine aldolase n=1 Tax=Alkaliphilus pronyensis TaxID=1482732 RepID=A0A6I0F8S8_9FIRM|nr:GntG family PLP-dependent aldolase [Alkaliphilus pronyensis]KAB3535213.1 threonine aldolase [Alkaliphilus pronyensis]